MNKYLLFLLVCIPLFSFSQSKQTYYYKLTKIIKNGIPNTNVNGWQFITISKNSCYDSDKNGISVGNGTLYRTNDDSTLKIYSGECYYGNALYKFKSDYSVLNIEINRSLVYVYKRDTPPSGRVTCSLIKKRKSSSSPVPTHIPPTNQQINVGTTNSYDNKTITPNNQRQKTKVRNKCHYCNGTGERIQHESCRVPTFGLDGPRVYCSKCNQSWNPGTVHAHHYCNYCKGQGYTEYEY